jgi:hypothetical protein
MSEKFLNRILLMPQLEIGEGSTPEIISDYETKLGLRFPDDYKSFLLRFGYASWFGNRITGISEHSVFDLLQMKTYYERKGIFVPKLSVILDSDFALRCEPAADAGRVVMLNKMPTLEEHVSFESFSSFVEYRTM